MVSGYLEHAGYKVYELQHAAEIMPKCASVQMDAILLDINLAKLAVYAEKINIFAKSKHIPIIFISESEYFDINYAFDLGADDYITQPVKRAELLIKIKTHLRTAKLARQLIASEARQTAILFHSPIGIAYTDLELDVYKTNSQFLVQYGYNEDIKNLSNILSGSAVDKFSAKKQWLEQLLQQGCLECEVQTLHKNGQVNWTYLRGKLINSELPEQGLVWTLDDISERKQAEDQLKLAATVFEVSGEAMIIMDVNYMVKSINPAMQRLSGYHVAELLRYSIAELLDSSYREETLQDILALVIKDQQWQGELWLNQKNSKQVPVRVMLNSVNRPDGSISHFVALLADISEHKEQEQELKHRANHDPLTGLPNRNLFFIRLKESLTLAQRMQYHVVLMYLDLDGFKPINDTLGHGKGDEVLQLVAKKLLNCVREVDTVARLGGDEFVIILNGTSNEQVSVTAERLVNTLTLSIDDKLPLSVSIGISVFPNDTINPIKLLQYADEAMYQAKQQGKHAYCWHGESPLVS
ncbi:MAG: hypothetical protein methR_P0030 [Methyloprofundus sp.]|nr:MAG: hypothetical protein methR_P0030 [Methyloprofundus sp.]